MGLRMALVSMREVIGFSLSFLNSEVFLIATTSPTDCFGPTCSTFDSDQDPWGGNQHSLHIGST